MLNLLIALAAGAVTTVALGFAFGGGDFVFGYGIVPGLIAFVAAYIFLARRTMKQVQGIIEKAQAQLQQQQIDPAIQTFKEAYPYARWQFLLRSQIDGQIGSILYMAQRFDEAEPYLKNAFKKSWVAQGMLGALYYKRKDFDRMTAAFEEGVKANKKESLLWNLYAYCLWKAKRRDEAIAVLNRAKETLGDDEKTERNLKALQNDRKMKMRGWNMMWYQFHLDRPPAQQMQRQMQHRRR